MTNIEKEKKELLEELRKLRKHANAMKISANLRKAYTNPHPKIEDMGLFLKAADCIDSLLREIERMEKR